MSPKRATSNHFFPLAGSGSLRSPRSLGKTSRCLPADFQKKPTCGAVVLNRFVSMQTFGGVGLTEWSRRPCWPQVHPSEQDLQGRARAGCFSWRDIHGQCSAPAPHLLPLSQGFEGGVHAAFPSLNRQSWLLSKESQPWNPDSSPPLTLLHLRGLWSKWEERLTGFMEVQWYRKSGRRGQLSVSILNVEGFQKWLSWGIDPQLSGLLPVRGGLWRMEPQPLVQSTPSRWIGSTVPGPTMRTAFLPTSRILQGFALTCQAWDMLRGLSDPVSEPVAYHPSPAHEQRVACAVWENMR